MGWGDLELVYNEIVRRYMAGFTLIELLLAVAIMGILAVIGISSFTQSMVKSRDTQRKNDLNQIAKAIESFNNDVGRYPKVSGTSMTCPDSGGTEVLCGTEIYAYIKGAKSTYMTSVPADSTNGRVYVYVPDASFGSFALYAALENSQDKDVVTSGGVVTDWGISCGSVNCNYKITETGLVRTR